MPSAAALASSASPMRLPRRVAAWRARLALSSLASPSPASARASSSSSSAAAAAKAQQQQQQQPGSILSSTPYPHPIVYHPDFTINPIPDGHRFPMPKDALLHSALRAAGAARVFEPRPADRDDLCLAHSPAYVDAFLSGGLSPKDMRRVGLPWSPELVRRTLAGVGSCVLAARLATQLGLAVTTNGGTHHAHAGHGGGFCVFNDLAVAARRAQADGLARGCFFVDLDVHQGDGTASIFSDDPSAYTLSVHCGAQAFPEPFGGDMDVALAAGTGDDAYMGALEAALPRAWGEFEAAQRAAAQGAAAQGAGGAAAAAAPVLALYNAGVDVHEDDELGRLKLTDGGIARRDRFVLGFFAERGVPLCAAIGGGYNLKDHAAIVGRHLHLHAAAGEYFGRFAAAADARRARAMAARAGGGRPRQGGAAAARAGGRA